MIYHNRMYWINNKGQNCYFFNAQKTHTNNDNREPRILGNHVILSNKLYHLEEVIKIFISTCTFKVHQENLLFVSNPFSHLYWSLPPGFLQVSGKVAISSRLNFQFEWACLAGNNGRFLNLHKHPTSFVYTGNVLVMLIYLNF